jgi:hypothetical protein
MASKHTNKVSQATHEVHNATAASGGTHPASSSNPMKKKLSRQRFYAFKTFSLVQFRPAGECPMGYEGLADHHAGEVFQVQGHVNAPTIVGSALYLLQPRGSMSGPFTSFVVADEAALMEGETAMEAMVEQENRIYAARQN